MSEVHNTTTPLRSDEGAFLHFSGEIPKFNIAYVPVSELVRSSDQLVQLQEELGRSTLELARRAEENQELLTRIADLEAKLRQPVEVTEHSTQAANSKEVTRAKVGNLPTPDSSGTKPDINLVPDPSLSPLNQRIERAIIYLLSCEGQAVRKPNAGGFLRSQLGIDKSTDWGNLRGRLIELGLIDTVKSSTHAKRLSEVSLNIEGLVAVIDKPFITPRVLGLLKDAGSTNGTTARSTDETKTDKTQPNTGSGNGNGNGDHSVFVMSPRIRRQFEREPDPIPGYRTRGKKPKETGPFLEHRRETRGAKKRH